MARILVVLVILATFVPCIRAQSLDSSLVEAKLLHFSGGMGISFGVGYAAQRPWVGLVSGVAVGVGKEVWDNYHENESFGWHATDVAITSAGSTLGYLLARRVVAGHRRRAWQRQVAVAAAQAAHP